MLIPAVVLATVVLATVSKVASRHYGRAASDAFSLGGNSPEKFALDRRKGLFQDVAVGTLVVGAAVTCILVLLSGAFV